MKLQLIPLLFIGLIVVILVGAAPTIFGSLENEANTTLTSNSTYYEDQADEVADAVQLGSGLYMAVGIIAAFGAVLTVIYVYLKF